MYHISVEARLTGPAAGMQAAQQMVVKFHFVRPVQRHTGPQLNGVYAAIDMALEKVATENGVGVAGFTLAQGTGNALRPSIDQRDLIGKGLLRPISYLAQNILLNTGCTLDMVITQITGPGIHVVNQVITHTVHPAITKHHRTLRETTTTLPTLGLEG